MPQVAPLLSAMEDSALAMAQDEYVHDPLVRCVLSVYFERDVGFREVHSILGRLSRLGLVRWRIRERGRVSFRARPGASARRHKATSLTMSAKGLAYFALPRRVRD